MMKVIEEEGLVDTEYVEQHTVGYDSFAERLRSLSLVDLSRACDVPESKIRYLARTYACTKPAAIRTGIGIQRCGGGAAAIRAVASLPAQTGAWRAVGGGLCTFGGAMFGAQDMGRAMRFDLSPAGTREINMVRLAEHLLDPTFDPPIKVIYNYNCNPAASLPDQPAVRAALRRPDLFMAVHDTFLTDTADYADIVLPATSPLEHEDAVLAYGGDFSAASALKRLPRSARRSQTPKYSSCSAERSD